MFWPSLQLFLHRQSVKRTAESIVCWTKVKEISTSVLDAKPVTFQKHTKTIIITCLHYLQDNMRNIMKMCLFYFSLWIFESHSIKKNCPKMDFWLKIHIPFKILFMRCTFDKECNQFKLQIAMDNNGMDIVCYTYFYQFQNTRQFLMIIIQYTNGTFSQIF